MVVDKISNLIIKLKNASTAGKSNVVVPNTKLNQNILNVLQDSKFVKSFDIKEKTRSINVELAYDEEGKSVITDVKRVSKLSKRVYMSSSAINNVRNGLGLTVVSTSAGIMSAKAARAAKVGGEVMFEIW